MQYIGLKGRERVYKIVFNLRKIRIERKLSQDVVANLCGVSQSHISEIELGTERPSLEMIESICNALHVHPFELMCIEE